jgi:superfamily I DNA/RNA helicase
MRALRVCVFVCAVADVAACVALCCVLLRADGFRGAVFEVLDACARALWPHLRREREGGGGDVHVLCRNYRSTPAIVAASVALVARNHGGAQHAAAAASASLLGGATALAAARAGGLRVQLVRCGSRRAEHARIVRQLRAWTAAGVALGPAGGDSAAVGVGCGVAVLFHTNDDVRAFVADARALGFACAAAAGATPPQPGELTVATIHAVKGLEFEIVFLAGLYGAGGGGGAPQRWPRPLDDEGRRKMYVAASRARSLLHISHVVTSPQAAGGGVDARVSELREALRAENGLHLLQDIDDDGDDAAAAPPHDLAALMPALSAAEAAAIVASQPGSDDEDGYY